MKTILIFLLCVFITNFIMCSDLNKIADATSDLKKEKQKSYDVIIGGSPIISFSGFVTYEMNNNKMVLNNESNLNILNQRGMYVIKFGISLPFSFFYYFSDKVAIGFTAKFGIIPIYPLLLLDIVEKQYTNYYLLEILGNARFSIKFGGYNSKFLIEAGILLNGILNLMVNDKYSGTYDNYFMTGPELFLGWDLKTKKGFSFILGGSAFASFGGTRFYYLLKKDKYLNIINVGGQIEVRFSYIHTGYKNR